MLGETGPLAVFELLPAIDIRGGRVVRLQQGDFERETSYEADPVAVAARFVAQGATWLHVVDLDGARDGEPRQLEIAAAVVAEVHGRARVELGGGLRTPIAVAGAIGTGAARVTVGTAALHDPEFVRSIVARHGSGRVVASIDVRDGIALGEGWRPGAAGMPADEAITMLAGAGISTFEVTSIAHDGLLAGPDLELLRVAGRAAERPDHRVGWRRVDRGRARGPGDRVRGRDRRQRAVRGPVRCRSGGRGGGQRGAANRLSPARAH